MTTILLPDGGHLANVVIRSNTNESPPSEESGVLVSAADSDKEVRSSGREKRTGEAGFPPSGSPRPLRPCAPMLATVGRTGARTPLPSDGVFRVRLPHSSGPAPHAALSGANSALL